MRDKECGAQPGGPAERRRWGAMKSIVLATLAALPVTVQSVEPYACATDPELVAPCFELRGRLSFWNGTPSARIWRVGTKRMLGVHADRLPPELGSKVMGFDTEIWGHYTVCPYTSERPGHMQFVCIEAWRDILIRKRPKA